MEAFAAFLQPLENNNNNKKELRNTYQYLQFQDISWLENGA